MQKESQSLRHQQEKDAAKDADVFSTVTTPPVRSVEIVNPTLKPREGMCNWCRNAAGDIFCDGFPICFNCIEIMIERENALGMNLEMYSMLPMPAEWEK